MKIRSIGFSQAQVDLLRDLAILSSKQTELGDYMQVSIVSGLIESGPESFHLIRELD